MDIYNPQTDSWSAGPAMPAAGTTYLPGIGTVSSSGSIPLATSGQVLTWNGTSWTPSDLNASQLSGRLSNAQLPSGVVTNNQSGLTLSGTLSGNGGGLTNVPLTALQSGGAVSSQTLTWNGTVWAPANGQF